MNNFIIPEIGKDSFTCPHCNVLAQQTILIKDLVVTGHNGSIIDYDIIDEISNNIITTRNGAGIIIRQSYEEVFGPALNKFNIAVCSYCKKATIWIDEKLVIPRFIRVSPPNEDMPEKVKELYLEASQVIDISVKSAGALLRLALQCLCEELGYKGNINSSIGEMVKDGVDIRVQKALDTIRVIGNNAVHPGEINVNERREDILQLFSFLNYIVKSLISDKKIIDDLFNSLPDNVLKGIENRDKN